MFLFLVALLTLTDILNYVLGAVGAVIVILIGIVVGYFVGKIVNRVVDRTVESHFDKSEVGRAFKQSGFDLSNFVGGVIFAFIVVVAITIAIGLLNIPGSTGVFIQEIAAYLPRLLGGILVIILGIVLVDFLASLIGKIIRPMFGEAKTEIADMLKNLIFLGLIAVILNIAFNLLLLNTTGLVYSLILGFVIIGAGIIITDTVIKSITDDYPDFQGIAGYAKFILYSIFLLIGAGAIFASFSGVTGIISTIAWGFAIAFALVLVPIVYSIAKKMQTQTQ